MQMINVSYFHIEYFLLEKAAKTNLWGNNWKIPAWLPWDNKENSMQYTITNR